MADCGIASQALDHIGLVEVVADEAQAAFAVEAAAVVGDDTGCLLSTMLQGMQSERGELGRIWMTEHAEDAALFVETIIALIVEVRIDLCLRIVSTGFGMQRHVRLPQRTGRAIRATRSQCKRSRSVRFRRSCLARPVLA